MNTGEDSKTHEIAGICWAIICLRRKVGLTQSVEYMDLGRLCPKPGEFKTRMAFSVILSLSFYLGDSSTTPGIKKENHVSFTILPSHTV